jgi:hypothetical protein
MSEYPRIGYYPIYGFSSGISASSRPISAAVVYGLLDGSNALAEATKVALNTHIPSEASTHSYSVGVTTSWVNIDTIPWICYKNIQGTNNTLRIRIFVSHATGTLTYRLYFTRSQILNIHPTNGAIGSYVSFTVTTTGWSTQTTTYQPTAQDVDRINQTWIHVVVKGSVATTDYFLHPLIIEERI